MMYPTGSRLRLFEQNEDDDKWIAVETGTVIGHIGKTGHRVQVDVNPADWQHSVIAAPSSITAIWDHSYGHSFSLDRHARM